MKFPALLLGLWLGAAALAGETPDGQAKPEEATNAYEFEAAGDTFYSWNRNHPVSGLNQAHFFDVNADAWSLATASLSIEHQGERFNFLVDSGFGQMAKTMVSDSDLRGGINEYIRQAYFGFKPFGDNPFRIEAGKFLTPAGGEEPETQKDFNTSRSLLFVLGIPFYHVGMRATAEITREWTAAIYVVNGWDNVLETSGVTFGATGTWKAKKQTLKLVYFAGPDNTATTHGQRYLADAVYSYTGKNQWNNYTELLWGAQGPAVWYGATHATRFNVSRNWSLSPRLGWFVDRNGATTGIAQRLIEVTGTVEYRIRPWMIARAELRRDLSNRQFFDSGNHPASSKTQDTALAGMTFLWKAER